MVSIAFMEKRCERLFDKADALKEDLDLMSSWHPDDDDTQKKLRQMNLMYREATAISMCLSAFNEEREKLKKEAGK